MAKRGVILALLGAAAIAAALLYAQTSAAPAASTRVTWRMRTTIAHQDLLQWRLAVPAAALPHLTLSEAAASADALGLAYIEASDGRVSADISKSFGPGLTAAEMAAVKETLRALNIRPVAYHVTAIGQGDSARKLFEFAKSAGIDMIVAAPPVEALPVLDDLAGEYGVKLALRNGGRNHTPAYWHSRGLSDVLASRSKRVGASVDVAQWQKDGVDPAEGLALLKERVFAVQLPAADAAGLLRRMYQLQMKPLVLTVAATGAAVEGFEKAVQPVLAAHVNELARATPITKPDKLPSDVRAKIEAALPRLAPAKPKKPRKLLVLDICVANYVHATIPHANLALELMGKNTGAYEAVFSNDLGNLKYDKIRQFDAVFLNNTVGEIFVDPEVREGLLRYVREGGGIGGLHGATYASRNWPEFGEMMGATDAPHRIEPGVIRIDDPASPINAAFGGEDLEYVEEYYRFYADGPYSRDKLHVLLSINVDRTDLIGKRPLYLRPDKDYGLSWIRSYGKGRVFNCAMGHTETFFMTPQLAHHILAGIQFILGDLPADTTPSAKLAAKKRQ